jgi:hypothetical protein
MDLPGLYCPAFFGAGKTRSQTFLDECPERPSQFSSPLFGGDQKFVGQFYGRFHAAHNTIIMGIFLTGILGIGHSTPELLCEIGSSRRASNVQNPISPAAFKIQKLFRSNLS